MLPSAAAPEPSQTPQPPGLTSGELNNQGVRAAQEGKWEKGVGLLRQALQVNPQDATAKKNLSGILTDWAVRLDRDGQIDRAVALLREAVQLEPENGAALLRLGDIAYFRRSEFADAIALWRKAHRTFSGMERRAVADRISQAQRDQAIEHSFESHRTDHFDIRVQGGQEVSLGSLTQLLEASYAKVQTELGSGPSQITVILYTGGGMRRTYNNRDWALGLYDGRLRLSADEILVEMAPALVSHELAHAFLHKTYGTNLPIWVQEGLAQVLEGPRPRVEEELELEREVTSGDSWVPLKWLDRRFTHPSSVEDVWRAYTQARLVAAHLVDQHGMESFKAFLQEISTGTEPDSAYDRAFAPDRWARTDRSILN